MGGNTIPALTTRLATVCHPNAPQPHPQDGRREDRLWISCMFTSEDFIRQNPASKATQLMSRWTRVNRFHTEYLDFPTGSQTPQKMTTRSQYQKSRWLVGIRRIHQFIKLMNSGKASRPGTGESTQVSKSGRRTGDCISRIRQNPASRQGKSLGLY